LKNVLITGASGGLGKLTTKYFADNGWNVIATMISLDLAEDLEGYPNVKCYQMDVTSTENIEEAKNQVLNDFKAIDVIINNAGLGYRSFVELSEDAKIDNIVNVNWLGVVKVCRSYELLDFNVSVCTVQFGNAPTDFQNNVTKSEKSSIPSYNKMMDSINTILNKKTNKNKNLTTTIVHKLFYIANKPSKSFRKYTIGFDANFMKYFRKISGYRLFNFIIKKKVL
jgi:NADPH:quinone reductase-like Zn-dependent oxidoreductase